MLTTAQRIAWILIVLTGAAAHGFSQPVDPIVFTTGKTPPVHTAWGNSEPGMPSIVVCHGFDFASPENIDGLIDDIGVYVTSPDGLHQSGAVTVTFQTSLDGAPGEILGEAGFQVATTPPAFPDASLIGVPDAGTAITTTFSTNTDYFMCVETDNTSVHVGGFVDIYNTIWLSSEGGDNLTEVQGYTLGFEISLYPEVSPEPPCEPQFIFQGGAGPGSNDAFFNTSLTIQNVGADGVTVNAGIIPRGGHEWQNLGDLPLGPRGMATVDVSELLAGEATFGTLRLRCPVDGPKTLQDDLGVSVQATIFADLPSGEQFGQIFQAEAADKAQQEGETTLLFTTHDPSRYRVNVGVTAMEDGTGVTVTPISQTGAVLAEGHDLAFDGGGNTQINDVHGFFDLGNQPNVMIEVKVASGAAFSYASVLDGASSGAGTSDPTTVLPVAQGSGKVTLLEVGRVLGLNEFSGSAMVHNHASVPATVRADFFERSTPGVADTTTFTLEGLETRGWDDIVSGLFERTDVVGTVVLSVTNLARISAIGREFAVFRDDQGEVVGTAGQLMPGLTDDDLLEPGFTYHYLGLRDREDASGVERSHLAVFNPGDSAVAVRVTGFSEGGEGEGATIERVADAMELVRVDRVLNAVNPDQDGEPKRIEVTVTGPVHVLAYRINTTGDPVTLTPFVSTGD